MKKYRVVLSATAESEAEAYADFISEKSGSRAIARRWLNGLQAKVNTLKEMPHRYAKIPEDFGSLELRQMMHHSHRVIYGVDEAKQCVSIYRVYHGSRQPLGEVDAL